MKPDEYRNCIMKMLEELGEVELRYIHTFVYQKFINNPQRKEGVTLVGQDKNIL